MITFFLLELLFLLDATPIDLPDCAISSELPSSFCTINWQSAFLKLSELPLLSGAYSMLISP